MTVTMTFSDSAITEVKVDTSKETIALAVDSAADFQEALMAAQSSEIDSVSGATITSKAVKKAAASCIEQAMGLASGEETTETVDDGTPKWLGTAPVIEMCIRDRSTGHCGRRAESFAERFEPDHPCR